MRLGNTRLMNWQKVNEMLVRVYLCDECNLRLENGGVVRGSNREYSLTGLCSTYSCAGRVAWCVTLRLPEKERKVAWNEYLRFLNAEKEDE